jgi:hypothetical protein
VRIPTYRFVIDADHVVFKLVENKTSYFYRRIGDLGSLVKHVRAGDKLRTISNSEAMVWIGENMYVISHACVNTNHCPHCEADVKNLCFRSDERGLVFHTHTARRDLWRKHNDGRATRRRK